MISSTALAQDAPVPSPSPAIGLAEIQSHLLANEILVVFKLDRPASSRWLIDREHAIVDAIAGRDAIAAAADPAQRGALLFRGVSTAAGRPLLAVGDQLLRELPLESVAIDGEPLVRRHSVTWFESVDELVAFRRAEPHRILTHLRILGLAAAIGASTIVLRRVLRVHARS